MYSRRNCLVLQPGERWHAAARRNTSGGTETAQGLPFHEMELAVDTENVLLVADVDSYWMRRARYRHYRHDAQKASTRYALLYLRAA